MAETTGISWCDSSVNFWIGCTEVSPTCSNCYAKRENERRGWVGGWGNEFPRARTKGPWKDPFKWNREHGEFFAQHGHRRRVFCNSLSDFFDNQVAPEWRTDAWAVIRQTKSLEWLVVTQRVGNVEWMLPIDWCQADFAHVVLLITVGDQKEANRDVPKLLSLKADYPWLRIGLSIEPMLGPIDLEHIENGRDGLNALECQEFRFRGVDITGIDWVIAGGESGSDARPSDGKWFMDLRDQCRRNAVPYHFKQWGEWLTLAKTYPGAHPHRHTGSPVLRVDGETYHGPTVVVFPSGDYGVRVGKGKSGRSLEGQEWNGFPRQVT